MPLTSVPQIPLSCPAHGVDVHSLFPTGRTVELTQAIVCSYDPYHGRADGVSEQGRFTSAQVRQINASYARRVTHPAPPEVNCMNLQPPDVEIVGENAWGDIVELHTDCYVYTPARSSPRLWWLPTGPEWTMIYAVLR